MALAHYTIEMTHHTSQDPIAIDRFEPIESHDRKEWFLTTLEEIFKILPVEIVFRIHALYGPNEWQ